MQLTNLYLGLYANGSANTRVRNHESCVSSEGSAAGTDSNLEKKPPVSPVHPDTPGERVLEADSSMVRPDHDMTWSTPSPAGNPPELAGVPAEEISELSLKPEHLPINKPNSPSIAAVQQLPSPQPGENLMTANLDSPHRSADGQRRAKNRDHIMSWNREFVGGDNSASPST